MKTSNRLLSYVLLKGGLWWVRHTKSQYWAVIHPFLAGKKKNSKGSSLHNLPHTVLLFVYKQTKSPFGELQSNDKIVWGTSPWCPCHIQEPNTTREGQHWSSSEQGCAHKSKGFFRWCVVADPQFERQSSCSLPLTMQVLRLGVDLSLEVGKM